MRIYELRSREAAIAVVETEDELTICEVVATAANVPVLRFAAAPEHGADWHKVVLTIPREHLVG
jgi:hypothetical protein